MDNLTLLQKPYWPVILEMLLEDDDLDFAIFEIVYDYLNSNFGVPRGIYCDFGGNGDLIRDILDGNDDQTRENIRIGPATFRRIVRLIPEKRHGWLLEIDVIFFLYWLADTCCYRTISNVFQISRSTTETILHRMLDIIIGLRGVITNSSLPQNYAEIGRKFSLRAGSNAFRNCIGAIDGTHIRIRCPVSRHDEYFNYKSFYSVHAQAVVTSEYLFSDFFVGFPGSVHDSRVLKNSTIFQGGRHTPDEYFLIGDQGNYALNLVNYVIVHYSPTPFNPGHITTIT